MWVFSVARFGDDPYLHFLHSRRELWAPHLEVWKTLACREVQTGLPVVQYALSEELPEEVLWLTRPEDGPSPRIILSIYLFISHFFLSLVSLSFSLLLSTSLACTLYLFHSQLILSLSLSLSRQDHLAARPAPLDSIPPPQVTVRSSLTG